MFVNGEPSWNLDDAHVMAGYQRFGELAEIVGLNWGYRWTSRKTTPRRAESRVRPGQVGLPAGTQAGRVSPVTGTPSSEVLARRWLRPGVLLAWKRSVWRGAMKTGWPGTGRSRVGFVLRPF